MASTHGKCQYVVGSDLVAKSCSTLVTPMDCSPPGSSVRGISQQEYWTGLPFPPPGGLPDPGIEPGSPVLQEDSLPVIQWGFPDTGAIINCFF